MSTQISNKKLKAIVFTDIVNFTQLSAKDEQHALELINKQREIVKPIVEKHRGEWLKEIGDGLLFSFDSSLDAVNCSIEIQQSLKDVDDFKIRIGIHQGDVFIKDGDVFGDDVNIASRVENFAPEGGIAISDKISKDISGVKNIKTSFIGHKKLKGVEQETQIRCIVSDSLPSYKISIFPRIAFYLSVFFGVIYLITTFVQVSLLIFGLTTWSEEEDHFIYFFTNGIILCLLAYNCLAYVRGMSIKFQKIMIYFTYLYVSYFLIDEVLISFFEEDFLSKNSDYYLLLFIFATLITISILVIRYFKKRRAK
tara:strand:+ start:57 stop:986 length:930 start_codon:yes stop_codon:yes gene_type:complete